MKGPNKITILLTRLACAEAIPQYSRRVLFLNLLEIGFTTGAEIGGSWDKAKVQRLNLFFPYHSDPDINNNSEMKRRGNNGEIEVKDNGSYNDGSRGGSRVSEA